MCDRDTFSNLSLLLVNWLEFASLVIQGSYSNFSVDMDVDTYDLLSRVNSGHTNWSGRLETCPE